MEHLKVVFADLIISSDVKSSPMQTVTLIILSILAFDIFIGLFMWTWAKTHPGFYDDECHPNDHEEVDVYYHKED